MCVVNDVCMCVVSDVCVSQIYTSWCRKTCHHHHNHLCSHFNNNNTTLSSSTAIECMLTTSGALHHEHAHLKQQLLPSSPICAQHTIISSLFTVIVCFASNSRYATQLRGFLLLKAEMSVGSCHFFEPFD